MAVTSPKPQSTARWRYWVREAEPGQFRGQMVHPQRWPADLDHAGKRVVVIGSGAMDRNRHSSVTPMPPANGELAPLIDLTSGYVQRGIGAFPKQGTVEPWRQQQNYFRDLRLLTRGPLDDHVVFASNSATLCRGVNKASAGTD
jgi:hypothetical protein